MPKMTGGVKTGRYYIRLPEGTIAEIDGYIRESGMYQAYFLSNALIVGARIMARQLNPERFYTHEMVEAMVATTNMNRQKGSAQGRDANSGRDGTSEMALSQPTYRDSAGTNDNSGAL
ncbi:MAG: hypothetical protein M3014_07985 [Chloroflexota bacterium]|nr:hypothetical protein [Chloroflexota bacterium]